MNILQRLFKIEQSEAYATRSAQEQARFEQSAAQLGQSVQTLKSTVSQWESELKTLKARVAVSAAPATINRQLAQLDSSGTVALLARLKEKVAVQEALGEACGELAQVKQKP